MSAHDILIPQAIKKNKQDAYYSMLAYRIHMNYLGTIGWICYGFLSTIMLLSIIGVVVANNIFQMVIMMFFSMLLILPLIFIYYYIILVAEKRSARRFAEVLNNIINRKYTSK